MFNNLTGNSDYLSDLGDKSFDHYGTFNLIHYFSDDKDGEFDNKVFNNNIFENSEYIKNPNIDSDDIKTYDYAFIDNKDFFLLKSTSLDDILKGRKLNCDVYKKVGDSFFILYKSPEVIEKKYNKNVPKGVNFFDGVDYFDYIRNKEYFSEGRIKYYIKGGKTVDVKQKCRVGGGAKCNQGDINNLILRNINENALVNDGAISSFVNKIKNRPFIESLINSGADIYIVGGVVRDLIMGKENKDIDLVVKNKTIDEIEELIRDFGKVDLAGKSFSVLKFVDKEDGLDYDIALPRTDVKNDSGGYKGFDIKSDPTMDIEKDLERRDIKINAMAVHVNSSTFIDPFNALNDIKNKVISAANTEAFSDDPLRMIRVVQFSSRFGFNIDDNTFNMIKEQANRIKEISPERILIEFEKIVFKGDILLGVELLEKTGLYEAIFSFKRKNKFRDIINKVDNLGEFLFVLLYGNNIDHYKYITEKLKGRIIDAKISKALALSYDLLKSSSQKNNQLYRSIVFNINSIIPEVIKSKLIPVEIQNQVPLFLNNKYPLSYKDLKINGNDLIDVGITGVSIGDSLKQIVLSIFDDTLTNDKDEIMEFVNSKIKNKINEGDSLMEYGCLMVDVSTTPSWKNIIESFEFKEDDIYRPDDEIYGIEENPHITIVYGFSNDINGDEIIEKAKETLDGRGISGSTGEIKVFDSDDCDVLVFGVENKILNELNKYFVKNYNPKIFHKDYQSHITICYLKKGKGSEYKEKMNNRISYALKSFTYSYGK